MESIKNIIDYIRLSFVKIECIIILKNKISWSPIQSTVFFADSWRSKFSIILHQVIKLSKLKQFNFQWCSVASEPKRLMPSFTSPPLRSWLHEEPLYERRSFVCWRANHSSVLLFSLTFDNYNSTRRFPITITNPHPSVRQFTSTSFLNPLLRY